jgi:hypothetical protein
MKIGPILVAQPVHEARMRRYSQIVGREFVITGVGFGGWMLGIIYQRPARSIARKGHEPF